MENSMLGSMYSWLGKRTLQDIYTAKHLGECRRLAEAPSLAQCCVADEGRLTCACCRLGLCCICCGFCGVALLLGGRALEPGLPACCRCDWLNIRCCCWRLCWYVCMAFTGGVLAVGPFWTKWLPPICGDGDMPGEPAAAFIACERCLAMMRESCSEAIFCTCSGVQSGCCALMEFVRFAS
jgi:hypothetical protein